MNMRLVSIAGVLALMVATPAAAQQGAGDAQGRGRLAACRGDVAAFCPSVEAGGGRKMACLKENLAKLSPACAEIVQARAEGKSERTGGRKAGRSALGAGAAAPQERVSDQPQGTVAQANRAPEQGAAPAAPSAQPGAPSAQSGPATATAGAKGGHRMAACRTDVATFCQNAEKGGGRMRCLKENQAKLSPECQTAVTERTQAAGNFRQACKSDRETLCAGVERGGGRLMQCLKENQAKLTPACGEAISAMPERGARGRGKRADSGQTLR